jgi:DNA helicase-2/ATP-dependent DNA helicase PcrA
LVDEYQDTNKAQFEITKLLAGKSRNITAVGDASQAIYSFRGADYRNLLLLQSEYPELTTVTLPRNYRSTQHILDSAYGVIRNNTGHPTIKLESSLTEGDKVQYIESLDEKSEAKKVVSLTKKYIDSGGQVVILYRTNAQSRAFEDELIRRCCLSTSVGLGSMVEQRKDLIAYLRIIITQEEIARKRLED